jgi:P pilus assembly chaperone PapD
MSEVRMELTRGSARRLFVAALFLSLTSAPAAAQLTVSPSELQLTPGVMAAAAFSVRNEDQAPVQASLYLNDWERDETGANLFDTLGSKAGSCGNRVEVFPMNVRIAPGMNQPIRVSLKPTDTLKTPCWTIVFVETTPRPGRGTIQIAYVTRMGIKVYVVPTTATLDAEISGFTTEKAQPRAGADIDTTKNELAVYVRSTGTVQIRAAGQVEIRRPDNSLAATVPVDETPILPGSQRRIGVTIPTLPAGRYIALAVIGFGGQDDLAAQAELIVP